MLVLSRRVDEEIVIAENYVLKVLSIQGGKVRLGVTAPTAVRIERQEVYDRRLLSDDDSARSEKHV